MYKLIAILLIFQTLSLNAKSNFLTPKSISEIENYVIGNKLLEHISNSDKFKLYNLVGRELINYKHYKKSLSYYEKALGFKKIKIDTTEALVNKMYLLQKIDPLLAKKYFTDFKKKIQGSNNKKLSQTIIKLWKNILFESKDINVDSHSGFYGEFFISKDVKILFNQEKFTEALSLIDGRNIKDLNIVDQIEYDLLRTIVFKGERPLVCEETLNKNKNSFAFTMRICALLKKYKSKEKLNDKDYALIERRIKKENKDYIYLMKGLRSLQ
jgi:tetratricopeptide (TPR) repeat protein